MTNWQFLHTVQTPIDDNNDNYDEEWTHFWLAVGPPWFNDLQNCWTFQIITADYWPTVPQFFPKFAASVSYISGLKFEAETRQIFHALSRLKSAAFDGRAEPRPQVHKKANYVIIVQTQDIKSIVKMSSLCIAGNITDGNVQKVCTLTSSVPILSH